MQSLRRRQIGWLLGLVLCLLPAPSLTLAQAPSETLFFSHVPTIARQPIPLTLTPGVAGTIRFTTNGSPPDGNSAVYSGPILIANPTVVRAQLFNDQGQPVGPVYTRSYLVVNFEPTLPLVSIAMSPFDFDWLQANPNERGREWERPINLEYLTPDSVEQFNLPAGLRIHGGKSRLYSPKKSFRLYFRSDYGGPDKLNYSLFADTPVSSFDKLVLRAGYNDTFTYRGTSNLPRTQSYAAKYIGDQVVRNLHRDLGQPVAHGRWVLLYINGQFWGLYNLTERIDLQFLQSYSTPDSQWDVIAKEIGDMPWGYVDQEEVKEGSYATWLENQAFVESADFASAEAVANLEQRIDLENLFSYMFLNAYVQNYDWPEKNWIIYRRSDPGAVGNEAKWRAIVWDAEYSFGSGLAGYMTNHYTLPHIYDPQISLTRLLERPFSANCAFRDRFVQRAKEYMGVENPAGKPPTDLGQLSKERIKAEIMTQATLVRPYIQMEIDRWQPPEYGFTLALFDQNINNALRFVDEREGTMIYHLYLMQTETFTKCR